MCRTIEPSADQQAHQGDIAGCVEIPGLSYTLLSHVSSQVGISAPKSAPPYL